MKFSLGLITTLVSVALCGLVHAAPTPLCHGLCADVATRDVADSMMVDDLVARAKKSSGSKAAATSENIVAVQKAQTERRKKVETKRKANKKTQQRAANSVNAKVVAFREQAKKGAATDGQIDKQSDKIRASEKSRVAAQARMDRKTLRTQEWAAKTVAKKAKGPKNVKLTAQEKNNVKNRFQAARQKFRQTQGMPARGQTVTVGDHSTTGRAVRQAVFNSYLHSKTPIGRNADNKLPKSFNNRPYSATHGDANLRGKKPLPQNGKEYPIINDSPNGWTGKGGVGALRAVTYKQGGKRRAEVIGHDPSRGGDHDDHYVATREVESFDMEDFE